ncbi:ribonuclease HII [Solibacillus sp. R5-41]|uniref:ribonuclease HII n=1 Tax=Solibacillus sp. R5-41 TaxID=2048654 RepID=UPI000C127DC2|nr:ribonuclease HII [Solibacillus sp. R5-41]ATP39334.1 ribonuclease HII [Solibacillus sp. R5-41]
MKTIKEITQALKMAQHYEPWMDGIQEDGRSGVQKAWQQYCKRLEKQRQLLAAHQEKLKFDASYLPHENAYLAGTDEAGRGPLAGPVVTAAVILPNYCEELHGINDSKQLSKELRENYAKRIKEHAIAYAIHFQSADEIDRLNIYEATRQSMKKSIEGLAIQPDFVLADAMTLPIDIAQASIVKGDAKSLAIAAASILAKTARDHYMEGLHEQFPLYGFAQHAGYGTKQHLEALAQFGPTSHHRKTFEPIKSMIAKRE